MLGQLNPNGSTPSTLESSPEVSRSARRKARTVATIVEAAEALFLRKGFHATTVEEIAVDADISVGSIYVHFTNKEGLYIKILERALEVEEQQMEAAYRPSLSLAQQLFAAGDAYLRFYLENPDYFRILVFPYVDGADLWPEGGLPAAAQRLAERAERQISRFAAQIDLAVRTGMARPIDPYRAAKFMFGAWNGVIAMNLRPDRLRIDDEELKLVLQEGQKMLAEGIASITIRHSDGSIRPEFAQPLPEVQR